MLLGLLNCCFILLDLDLTLVFFAVCCVGLRVLLHFDLRFSCFGLIASFSWVSVMIQVFLHFLFSDKILRVVALGWGLTESGEKTFLFEIGVEGCVIWFPELLVLAEAQETACEGLLIQEFLQDIYWSCI